MAEPADWRIEEAENQSGFRDFNEWIKRFNQRIGNHRPLHEYVCECSDASCRQSIEVSDEEYDLIRSHGARFAIALDHENPEIDVVMSAGDRFATIEKLPGWAATLAIKTDPRRSRV